MVCPCLYKSCLRTLRESCLHTLRDCPIFVVTHTLRAVHWHSRPRGSVNSTATPFVSIMAALLRFNQGTKSHTEPLAPPPPVLAVRGQHGRRRAYPSGQVKHGTCRVALCAQGTKRAALLRWAVRNVNAADAACHVCSRLPQSLESKQESERMVWDFLDAMGAPQ